MGSIMAGLSFIIDYMIEILQEAHYVLYTSEDLSIFVRYLIWVGFTSLLVTWAVSVTRWIAPAAAGSGIPEMKTIMRSPSVHKEYVKWPVLVAKLFGLVLALGSRLPVGKEGPFVHVASIVTILLCRLQNFALGKKTEDARMTELLSAACAVGVSCCFAAPIGGVLFSIEVTSTYFAVRDYWRAFFGSVMAALVFRIAAVFWKDEETLTALFRTSFRVDFPFDILEILAFVIIGIIAGLAAANFVIFHKYLTKQVPKIFKTKNQRTYIYPTICALVYSTLTFPGGLGKLIAGELDDKQAILMLFENKTWSDPANDYIDETPYLQEVGFQNITNLQHVDAFGWNRQSGKPTGPNLYISLTLFILVQYLSAAVAQTINFPCGVFMPIFMVGAAFGRLVGESMYAWFPAGFKGQSVIPGGYAVVGAAAFAGGVTHTISTSVVVFELTGQISHCLPVLLAVLVSNAIAQYFSPSIYDSMIILKKLPHLPDLRSYQTYNTSVENFMNRDVCMVHASATSRNIREILGKNRYSVFPLVDSLERKLLIGAISRAEMRMAVEMEMPRPLENASVNPAPAMVSDKISLHRLHTMFSLLNLKRAFVVTGGQLVGIVTISELTKEIIGAARSFNRAQRAISSSSLQSLVRDEDVESCNTNFDTVFNDEEEEEEVIVGDFVSPNRINLHVYNRSNL